jgi:hypothetical protein
VHAMVSFGLLRQNRARSWAMHPWTRWVHQLSCPSHIWVYLVKVSTKRLAN